MKRQCTSVVTTNEHEGIFPVEGRWYAFLLKMVITFLTNHSVNNFLQCSRHINANLRQSYFERCIFCVTQEVPRDRIYQLRIPCFRYRYEEDFPNVCILYCNHPTIVWERFPKIKECYWECTYPNFPQRWPPTLCVLSIQGCQDLLKNLPSQLMKLKLSGSDKISCDLPSSLTSLEISANFVTPPIKLSQLTNLVVLNLRHDFDQPISFPSSLHTLHFNSVFKQSMPPLPASLTRLTLPYFFNDPDFIFPANLEFLSIDGIFNHPLTHLPKSLIELRIHGSFNHPLCMLPPNLRVLEVSGSFSKSISFPKSLEMLILFRTYGSKRLSNLPSSLIYLEVRPWAWGTLPTILPKSLEYLILGHCTNLPRIPKTLRYLEFLGNPKFYRNKNPASTTLCVSQLSALYGISRLLSDECDAHQLSQARHMYTLVRARLGLPPAFE